MPYIFNKNTHTKDNFILKKSSFPTLNSIMSSNEFKPENIKYVDMDWKEKLKKCKDKKEKENENRIPYGWVKYSFDKSTNSIIIKNIENTDWFKNKELEKELENKRIYTNMISRWNKENDDLNNMFCDTSPTWRILEEYGYFSNEDE